MGLFNKNKITQKVNEELIEKNKKLNADISMYKHNNMVLIAKNNELEDTIKSKVNAINKLTAEIDSYIQLIGDMEEQITKLKTSKKTAKVVSSQMNFDELKKNKDLTPIVRDGQELFTIDQYAYMLKVGKKIRTCKKYVYEYFRTTHYFYKTSKHYLTGKGKSCGYFYEECQNQVNFTNNKIYINKEGMKHFQSKIAKFKEAK